MSILITCCVVLAMAYALLMMLYRIGWSGQRVLELHAGFTPKTKISVIIPARNEGSNISACARSVLQQDYPEELLEVIVVDDHSEDDTAFAAANEGDGRVRVISLKEVLPDEGGINAFKKKALSVGIAASSGTLIVTTDADCIAPPGWLRHVAAVYEEEWAVMVIGPVAFTQSWRIVGLFQSLDFAMMQGITAAAHRLKLGGMANGANLAFARATYDAVGGYEGTTHLASGDDYLLLHKIAAAFPGRVHYLKSREAIITTPPQPTWADFLQQRIRWASKSGKYSDYPLTGILGLVYLFNVSVAVLAFAGFWDGRLWHLLGAVVLIKILSELLLLYPVARFFGKVRELWLFPVLQPLHIAYIILAGFLGMKGGYRWKGRKVK